MSSGGKRASNGILDAALKLLSIRQRSVKEVYERLSKKGFGAPEIGPVVQRLLKEGLLDDIKFARSLASSRARVKNWGTRKITAELISRGVAAEAVKEALSSLDAPDEAERARAVFQRWLKSKGFYPPLQKKDMARAFRHLSGRGFAAAVIMQAIGKVNPDE